MKKLVNLKELEGKKFLTASDKDSTYITFVSATFDSKIFSKKDILSEVDVSNFLKNIDTKDKIFYIEITTENADNSLKNIYIETINRCSINRYSPAAFLKTDKYKKETKYTKETIIEYYVSNINAFKNFIEKVNSQLKKEELIFDISELEEFDKNLQGTYNIEKGQIIVLPKNHPDYEVDKGLYNVYIIDEKGSFSFKALNKSSELESFLKEVEAKKI